MRGEEFLDKLEYVAADLIEEADRKRKRKKKGRVIALGGLAAGLAAAAGVAFYLGPGTEHFPLLTASRGTTEQGETADRSAAPSISSSEAPSAAAGGETQPVRTEELPLLTVSSGENEGQGFEGLMAYDVSELTTGNPWREDMEIAALPVYRNKLTFEESTGRYVGGDAEARKERLLDMAGRLGLDTGSLAVTGDAPDEEEQERIAEKLADAGESVPEGFFEPSVYSVEGNGIEVQVDEDMTVTVWFDPIVSLPEGYTFDRTSYGEMEKTAEYLRSAYSGFLGMREPQTAVSGGDYSYNLEQWYDLEFYEGSGSLEEQIIQYNFYRTEFAGEDEMGGLYLARAGAKDLSEKVGDYPVISAEKARELLSSGNYITTVCDPAEMPGMEYAAKVELVYRTGNYEEYFMPYYRFLVELPTLENEGLKTYGAYYVPAVEERYLTGLPVWDGRFN